MIEENSLPLSIFKEKANDDFFKLIAPLKKEKKYVSAPPYLTNFFSRLIHFSKNKFLIPISFDGIKPDAKGDIDLIIISPAESTNINLILNKFETIPNYTKSLFIIPRITAQVQQAFDSHGFNMLNTLPKDRTKDIYTTEFHADFLALDDDYFLLPCYRSFYQINAENDFNDLYASARALAKFQTVFGVIPSVITIGPNAERTKSLMRGIMGQAGSLSTQSPQMEILFIFDRQVDIVTPLLSQSTFEGMADELFGINFGYCQTTSNQDDVIVFTEKDKLISEFRSELLVNLPQLIQKYLDEYKYIASDENTRNMKNLEFESWKKQYVYMEKKKNEMETFRKINSLAELIFTKTNQLPLFQPLRCSEFELVSVQTSVVPLAEKFIQYINDWKTAMRLLLLDLATGANSITPQMINESLADEFGQDALATIKTLERIELLKSNHKLSKIYKALGDLGLVGEIDDITAMCDKVVPAVIRILEKLLTKGLQFVQTKKLTKTGINITIEGQPSQNITGRPRRILMFFVGGVTASEVGFLRKLGKEYFQGKVQIIIGSTDQVNSNSFTEQLCPGLFNQD